MIVNLYHRLVEWVIWRRQQVAAVRVSEAWRRAVQYDRGGDR